MMADVYKFKIKLCELENVIWRDIEITSVSSVAKLGYVILAAFESTASHLFNIQYNDRHYEIIFEEDDFNDKPIIDPTNTKLSSLKLNVGDKLKLEYDYGAGWEFDIELLLISEMQRGTGKHYPFVTDGKGRGIIEDTSPYELVDIVEQTDKDGTVFEIMDMYSGEKILWDYRVFNIDYCNMFLKDEVRDIREAYERYE